MSADALIQALSWAIFILIAIQTILQAVRRPTRVQLDIALFFGVALLIIILSILLPNGTIASIPAAATLISAALLSLPYLLVRLLDDVVGVPILIRRVVDVGFVLSVATVALLPIGRPPWVDLLLLVNLLLVLLYVVAVSVRATIAARGVTRRRLAAVSVGSLCIALNFFAGSASQWLPIGLDDSRALADIFGLAAGISYFVGFTPPSWLRRAWQEPELRGFLMRAAQLPRLPDMAAIIAAIEQGARTSLGAPHALVGLWDSEAQLLRFTLADAPAAVSLDSEFPAMVAFRTQRPTFSPETHYQSAIAATAQFNEIARAVLAAPITAGQRNLGVLTVFAARAPIFADDDLALLQLLADQAAVILESRQLIDEAARVQASETATRLKDDFLSAAAHDLKTPLTTLVVQAQLLERRAERTPEAPVDRAGLRRIVQESERLSAMVIELLDATRVEQRQLIRRRAPTDLTAIVADVVSRHATPRHPCRIVGDQPLVGLYDTGRMTQLVENLVENAVKYSPDGGQVVLTLWRDDTTVHLRVTDHGIGIPADDLPQLFARFHRGKNVDDRRFPGMGLGLYICHGIVAEHGGTIDVDSQAEEGSSFHVALPLATYPSEVQLATHSHY